MLNYDNYHHFNANQRVNTDYYDYESHIVHWNMPDRYEIIRKIGRGKYSEVFRGYDTRENKHIVIKILKPVKRKKILREIKILSNLSQYTNDGATLSNLQLEDPVSGRSNVIQLLDIVRDPHNKISALIFENVNAVDFRVLYPTLTDVDVRYYMRELCKALNYAHRNGIMHRDVKPHNIMIDPTLKQLKLIDWGLAEFYHKDMDYNVRVASRFFKGPELLVDHIKYHYSLDMWSLGCTLASIIFMIEPFFYGADNQDQLVKIVEKMGYEKLCHYLNKYNLSISNSMHHKLRHYPTGKPLRYFVTDKSRHLCSDMALDFLDKLLRYDINERLTTEQALQHPYLSTIPSINI